MQIAQGNSYNPCNGIYSMTTAYDIYAAQFNL